MAEAFAREHNLTLFFTSAHTGINVAECFDSIARLAVDKQRTSMSNRAGAAGNQGSTTKLTG